MKVRSNRHASHSTVEFRKIYPSRRLTRNQTIIPAKVAITTVKTMMGQESKMDPAVAFVKMTPSCFFRVIRTTPGTRIIGTNLLYSLCPYDVFVTGKPIPSNSLLLLFEYMRVVLPYCLQ